MAKGGYVYIMASGPHGTLYVGVTANLPRRIWEHRNDLGSEFCTENGCKFVVYYDVFDDIEEAIKREAAAFDTLRPGEDMVGLEQAFAAAEEYRPGEGKKK